MNLRAPGAGMLLLRRSRAEFALLAWIACACGARAAPTPPPAVTVATVQQGNVAPSHEFVGRVTAIQSVQIVPRVTAFIDNVPVKEGSDVKTGDVIYELQKTSIRPWSRRPTSARPSSTTRALRRSPTPTPHWPRETRPRPQC